MTDDAAELSTWTLGSVKASGMELEGGCKTPGCNEFARFDVDGLISRFGADWLVPVVLPGALSDVRGMAAFPARRPARRAEGLRWGATERLRSVLADQGKARHRRQRLYRRAPKNG